MNSQASHAQGMQAGDNCPFVKEIMEQKGKASNRLAGVNSQRSSARARKGIRESGKDGGEFKAEKS